MLSNKAILEARARGDVVIEPFDVRALNTNSYDLTLGRWVGRFGHFARLHQEIRDEERAGVSAFQINHAVYPSAPRAEFFSGLDHLDGTSRFWFEFHSPSREECEAAKKLDQGLARLLTYLIDDTIRLLPGERILGMTRERAGGVRTITSKLGATSTAGRHGITVCECAGVGDVGYTEKWTLEITNNTPEPVSLPIGAVVAQIEFHEVGEILPGTGYGERGSYNGEVWRPSTHMAPKKLKVRL